METPIKTQVKNFEIKILNEKRDYSLPKFLVPKYMNYDGNYIISLSETVRWLGQYAEDLGIQIYPSFPASDLLINPKGYIEGIICNDFGIDKT